MSLGLTLGLTDDWMVVCSVAAGLPPHRPPRSARTTTTEVPAEVTVEVEQAAVAETATEPVATPSTETAPEPEPEPAATQPATDVPEVVTTVVEESVAVESVQEVATAPTEAEAMDTTETGPRPVPVVVAPPPVKRERSTSIGSSLAAGLVEVEGAGEGGIEIHEPPPEAARPPLQPVAVKQEQGTEPPAPRRRDRPVKRGASQLPEGVEVVVLSSGDEEPGNAPDQ